jgi:hypothetical protein
MPKILTLASFVVLVAFVAVSFAVDCANSTYSSFDNRNYLQIKILCHFERPNFKFSFSWPVMHRNFTGMPSVVIQWHLKY